MSDEEIYKSDLELLFYEKFVHFHAYCVQKNLYTAFFRMST